MDPIFGKPIFVYMTCTYKQEWPGLTRVRLETNRLHVQMDMDGSIRRDETNLNFEFLGSDEQPNINVGDEFKVTLKKLV